MQRECGRRGLAGRGSEGAAEPTQPPGSNSPGPARSSSCYFREFGDRVPQCAAAWTALSAKQLSSQTAKRGAIGCFSSA